MAVSSALLSGKADEINTSLTKISRKADKKKKGPRTGRIVGLSSGMAHEMAVSSAFLHYGRRNFNFVPRVFFISSVNVVFLVVKGQFVCASITKKRKKKKSFAANRMDTLHLIPGLTIGQTNNLIKENV